jgi:hypothetical protein
MPGEKKKKKGGFGRPDDTEEVLKITYEPRGLGETGWGWRMPENPDRVLGGFTEDEQVVMRTLRRAGNRNARPPP